MSRNSKLSPYERRLKRKKEKEQRKKILVVLLLLLFAGLVYLGIGLLGHRFSFESISGKPEPNDVSIHSGEGLQFLTPTGTNTFTPSPTVPTATPTITMTATATMTLTPSLTPTPKIRPKLTTVAAPAESMAHAEETLAVEHAKQGLMTPTPQNKVWFEMIDLPASLDANLIYSNAGCTWMGIAGNLTDNRNVPQVGYYVRVGFPDERIEETLSGLYPVYGEGGYEITLARPVQAFETPLWIRIYDSNHIPVSEKIYFKPSSDCANSLTLFNFVRTK